MVDRLFPGTPQQLFDAYMQGAKITEPMERWASLFDRPGGVPLRVACPRDALGASTGVWYLNFTKADIERCLLVRRMRA